MPPFRAANQSAHRTSCRLLTTNLYVVIHNILVLVHDLVLHRLVEYIYFSTGKLSGRDTSLK